VRDDDLAPFAIADGLVAAMSEQPASMMTSLEREYLLAEAARNLAKLGDLTVDEAARLLAEFTEENQLRIQCSEKFALVAAYGRLLVVFGRSELRGRVHPASN
jgi:hypothetical protein